ncbi:MAG: hypothetical protein ACK4G3_02240 [bacterium]
MLNALFGWSVIGWLVALFYGIAGKKRSIRGNEPHLE